MYNYKLYFQDTRRNDRQILKCVKIKKKKMIY